MLRGFRHTLFVILQLGIFLSALVALIVQPVAWRAIAICAAGGMIVVWICERLARRWLRTTFGRLRRVADDIGHGRPTITLTANRGDDLYKLVSAVNLIAARLEESTKEGRRLQEQLHRTERLALLGELAASVAHEINNPLDGIQSCARILRRSLDDPQRAAQMLDLMDNGLTRIDIIVRRLLTLAREHVIRPVETRLTEVIEAAVTAVMARITTRQINVHRQLDVADDRIMADPQLLEQVFVNLLLNAVDSMSAGDDLIISMWRESKDDGRDLPGNQEELVVQVADTGSGIPADVLPHIFEPFFTTKADGKGTGLGLPIAARIVDAHQGVLSVDTPASGGTVFTIRLPACAQISEVLTETTSVANTIE
ncbi:MAG: ATP-binding protein [Planctomycetota bacterium]